jgi:MFS family permease
VVGISIALGPLVGGALVQTVGWRGIFWVNIPVGLAALILTALFVPESRAPRARRVDPVGQLLVIVTLASLTYAIIEGPTAGWTSAQDHRLFALAAPRRRACSLRAAPPGAADRPAVLPQRAVLGRDVIAVSAFAALGGFLFLNTLYLQDVRGYSAFHAGLYTLPMAAMTLVFAPLSGRIVGAQGTAAAADRGRGRDNRQRDHADSPDRDDARRAG